MLNVSLSLTECTSVVESKQTHCFFPISHTASTLHQLVQFLSIFNTSARNKTTMLVIHSVLHYSCFSLYKMCEIEVTQTALDAPAIIDAWAFMQHRRVITVLHQEK